MHNTSLNAVTTRRLQSEELTATDEISIVSD